MDPASQFSFNTRHGGRNGSQSTKNDRQLPESSSTSFNHPRQNNHSSVCISQPRQSFPNRHNSTPSEQRSTDLSVQFQKPVALHFDYHSRYPSPPTTQRSPNSLSSSPPLHPSPNLHRSNGSSSSSAGSSNLSMITLPPLSAVAHHPHPHPHRGVVDHSPNHHHQQQQQVDLSSLPAIQRKPPSITQLPRNHHPEQGAALRRHTLDSGYVPPDPQLVSGGRKRTLSTLPSPITHHSTGSQQQVPQPPPLPPPLPPQQQQGQTNNKLTTRRYPSPPPTSNSRRENPPSLAMSPSPILPLQISQSSQDPSSSSPITSADDAADLALEPLRLGFENIWSDTVQNVRHIMGKMQNDLSRLNAAENRKNVNLMRCLVGTSEKLKSQEWAVEELKKENGLLVKKAVEDEQMRRGESGQQRGMVDGLRRENGELRRENEELRRKNEECKEGLRKAAEFIFQYKEELRKVRADAEMLRKCREAGVISSSANNDHQTTPVPAPPPAAAPAAAANTDLHREITRLHAEKERERIFNDAVKQLRALTALEDSPNTTTRERDSEEEMEMDDVKTASTKADSDNRLSSGSSSSLEVSTTLKQNSTSPLPVCIVDERQPRLQSANQAQVVSIDEDLDSEGKCKVEDVDHEMDVEMKDDDVRIVPPITTNPNPDADAEQQTHDSRIFKEERESPLSDLEMQRQRQRQALRGPPPTALCSLNSSPQAHSRKTSQTGVKRDREEYEEGQVDEDEDGGCGGRDRGRDVLGSDEPGIILEEEEEKSKESPMHGSTMGMQAMVADADDDDDDNCSEGEEQQQEEQEEQEEEEEEEPEIVILERREVKDNNNNMPKKRQKDVKKDFRSDGGRQQVIIVPQTGIKKKSTIAATAAAAAAGKGGQTNAKTLSAGKRSHYRDAPPISLTSLTRRSFVTTATSPYQSIIPPPPLLLARSSPQPQPQPRLQKKLGISHMDLLYKTEREVMVCRFCLSLEQNVEATATTAERRKLKANTQKFPLNASWADLINHCQTEHTKACEDMEKLSPSQLAEMKQRTR